MKIQSQSDRPWWLWAAFGLFAIVTSIVVGSVITADVITRDGLYVRICK